VNRPSALVTGGSRGIGLAIARCLASRGWSLTLAARKADQLEQARAELADSGADVQVVSADMACDADIATALGCHTTAYGGLSALVLAAGVGSAAPLAGYPMGRFDKQFAVNVRAPYALISQALPLLRSWASSSPHGRAHIVAISSIEGLHPEPGLAAYGASKSALISLMQSVNAEENVNGVLATAISPAFVATDLSEWTTGTIPFADMISTEDVAKVVGLLLDLSPNALLPHVVLNRVGASVYHA
jgi:NAD(P)-dependent dehydrogenase (short-subunit alcohol dehydrogenase family)